MFIQWAGRWLRRFLLCLGAIALMMAMLAFTSVPFHAHRWLGTAGGLAEGTPELILVLSGSGMPSGPELMRCDVAARWAARSPAAEVVLLLPADTGLADAMVAELATKGVAPARITLLMHGRNTREQALDAAQALAEDLGRSIALVTSPEHTYRALLSFRKVGFTNIAGAPAFDHALFDDLRYDHERLGGRPYVPDISGNSALRYDFWNRLSLEISCLREYAALTYYKANGWI
jgi:uncharacterized SAM-binding protein YcdF (DUF218 family)